MYLKFFDWADHHHYVRIRHFDGVCHARGRIGEECCLSRLLHSGKEDSKGSNAKFSQIPTLRSSDLPVNSHQCCE